MLQSKLCKQAHESTISFLSKKVDNLQAAKQDWQERFDREFAEQNEALAALREERGKGRCLSCDAFFTALRCL